MGKHGPHLALLLVSTQFLVNFANLYPDGLLGIDMANAFLVHLVGEETTKKIRGVVEAGVRAEGDDEYAEFYGLV